jgi:hypothetical protein
MAACHNWDRLSSPNRSLQFAGFGAGVDRVAIKIDPDVPANVGAGDFTIDFWMKVAPNQTLVSCAHSGLNSFTPGRVLFDRDFTFNTNQGHGDFGIALFTEGIGFGSTDQGKGYLLCGKQPVADQNWHHIAVTRRRSDGKVQIFVDGALDQGANLSTGDFSYLDGQPTMDASQDPYLIIGAEKSPSDIPDHAFSGWLDEVRISSRFVADPFSPVRERMLADSSTLVLYHFDEASGTDVLDASDSGASPGVLRVGGDPAGPLHSDDTPF